MSFEMPAGQGLKINKRTLLPEEEANAFTSNETSRKKLYDLSVTTNNEEKKTQSWATRSLDASMYDLFPEWVHTKLGTTNNLPNSSTTELTQATQQVKDTVANAVPPKTEWLTQVDLSKAMKNVMDMIPKELKDFFRAIFWPLLWLSKNITNNKESINVPSLKPDWKKILDDYWVKSYKGKERWTTELEFGKEAKLIWTRLEATQVPNKTDEKQTPKRININEGKVIIQEGAEVASVSEVKAWIVKLEIKNKDGSVETYILTDAKKVEKPA